MTMLQAPSGDRSALLGVLAIAGLGYAGYRFWYLPMQAEDELRRRAQTLADRTGQSPQSATDTILSAVCSGAGLAYGIPPALSGPLCDAYGAKAIKGVGKGSIAAVKSLGSSGKKVGSIVGSSVASGAKSLVKSIRNIF